MPPSAQTLVTAFLRSLAVPAAPLAAPGPPPLPAIAVALSEAPPPSPAIGIGNPPTFRKQPLLGDRAAAGPPYRSHHITRQTVRHRRSVETFKISLGRAERAAKGLQNDPQKPAAR